MEAGELAEASTGWAVLPEQQEPLAYAPQPPPAVEPTVLDGVEINEQTSSTVLKEAARKLGLSTAGSRSRLYQRVKSFLDKQRLGLEMQLAADAQQLEQREARVQPVPRQPTAQERLLHEATHLPFQPWCGHCVAMRSMPDRAESLVDVPRDIPTISYDFCFTGFDEEGKLEDCPAQDAENRRALKCMIIHDTATGSVAAVPCESKGDNKYLGLELMRFIQSLGHTTCELRCDAEQATLSLQTAVVRARLRLGMRTIVRNPAVGAHSSSGYVEKAVDCVRKLANTSAGHGAREDKAYNWDRQSLVLLGVHPRGIPAEPLSGHREPHVLRKVLRRPLFGQDSAIWGTRLRSSHRETKGECPLAALCVSFEKRGERYVHSGRS